MAGAVAANRINTRIPDEGVARCEDSAPSARLVFSRGAARVSLRADRAQAEHYRARFEGIDPRVVAEDGRVTVDYAPTRPRDWLRARRRSADVTLSPARAWALDFDGGVDRLRADLHDLELASITVRAGATDVELLLPEPRGVVPIQVTGGVSDVKLHRPRGTALRVRVRGGAVKLDLDGRRLRAIGEETWEGSAGPGDAINRYEVDIDGGASELTVAEAR